MASFADRCRPPPSSRLPLPATAVAVPARPRGPPHRSLGRHPPSRSSSRSSSTPLPPSRLPSAIAVAVRRRNPPSKFAVRRRGHLPWPRWPPFIAVVAVAFYRPDGHQSQSPAAVGHCLPLLAVRHLLSSTAAAAARRRPLWLEKNERKIK
ncbi:uncharacterized protein J3R85_019856 [Psidium guajava]|nr:uncharacterized protein J3R85_019856 [Psidium guajava]